MTQKELLYVEDAYKHEENIVSYLNDLQQRVDDEEVLSFVKKEEKMHSSYMEKILNMLKEKSNE